jgi:hypothetical protein
VSRDIKRALNALVDQPPAGRRTLDPAPDATPIPAQLGVGKPGSGGGGSSGGIASPLTEQGYTSRDYYAPKIYYSTDGLFSFQAKPIKALKFNDASGAPVQFNFAQPPA